MQIRADIINTRADKAVPFYYGDAKEVCGRCGTLAAVDAALHLTY